VAAQVPAWAALFFPSFQAICYAFKEILEHQTPLFIRIYNGFVGFSGSTNLPQFLAEATSDASSKK
jgi:hypothetical protein